MTLKLRIYVDEGLLRHCSKSEVDSECGFWLFLEPVGKETIEDLIPLIVGQTFPWLSAVDKSILELRSANCRFPAHSLLSYLNDGQEITVCLADQVGRKKARIESPTRSPHSMPFSTTSPAIEDSVQWQEMRKRLRAKEVPDWAVQRLPADITICDRGKPASGVDGVNWHVDASGKVGWEAILNDERAFYPLDEFTHEESIRLCKQWLSEQKGWSSDNSDQKLSPVQRSDIRGVALSKGSWKARWRDSSGRQRMRTFGPTSEDKAAAEKFILEVRASLVSRKRGGGSAVRRSSNNSTTTPHEDPTPEDFLPVNNADRVIKQEESKELLVSLLASRGGVN